MDALRTNPEQLPAAELYFIRLNDNNLPMPAGKPYCTICSKLALDTGMAMFSLWDGQNWCTYPAEQYNDISFDFDGE